MLELCTVYRDKKTPDEWVRALSFPSFCFAFNSFSVLYFLVGKGAAVVPILLSFTSYPTYTCFGVFKSPNVWRTFSIDRFSKPEKSQKNPVYLRSTVNRLHQVTHAE